MRIVGFQFVLFILPFTTECPSGVLWEGKSWTTFCQSYKYLIASRQKNSHITSCHSQSLGAVTSTKDSLQSRCNILRIGSAYSPISDSIVFTYEGEVERLNGAPDLRDYSDQIRNANFIRYSYFLYSKAVQLIKIFLAYHIS